MFRTIGGLGGQVCSLAYELAVTCPVSPAALSSVSCTTNYDVSTQTTIESL